VSDAPGTGAAPHALLRPRIVIPFLLVALIWGSTWLVIKDQVDAPGAIVVPPSWSVTWRFLLAAVAMALFALIRRERLVLDRRGHLFAAGIGLTQFCLNFNLVYRAELFVTSGIVAVLFALLMLPNALLGRLVLGSPVTRRFMAGTGIALVGIAMMLAHEARMAELGSGVWWGVGLVCLGILSASIANVMQATPGARTQSMVVLLAFAMAWGAAFDFVLAWITSGPPVLPLDARYLGGVAYLAIIGSVVTFPLYFQLIREIGPGRAAYNGVIVPVVAMVLSTLFEGYRWSWLAAGGGALAIAGLVVALRARKPIR
jgi:drug/metabolite transporter (DMT)-like permease